MVKDSRPSRFTDQAVDGSNNIVFIFDSDHEVGYGHEARCKRIEQSLKARQSWSSYAYGSIKTEAKSNREWKVIKKTWGRDGLAIREAAKEIIGTGCSVVVCDANNKYHSKAEVRLLLERIREHSKNCVICVIDDIYDNSVYNESLEVEFTPDLLVIPYLHTREYRYSVNEECRILKGLRYATARPLNRKKRDYFTGEEALNILISFGRSRKGECSARRIAMVVAGLKIGTVGNVVVTASGSEIGDAQLVGTSRELIEVCEDIDIAIIGSGTTRYEMLKWGIPMLTFAQFEDHISTSIEFADSGLCVYGGLEDRLETSDLQKICKSFIEDKDVREQLVLTYERVNDQKSDGAKEIARELETIYNSYRRA